MRLSSFLCFASVKHPSLIVSPRAMVMAQQTYQLRSYYALVQGAAYSLGTQSMHEDWGLKLTLTVRSGSSSARSFSKRRGLGKQRHVQTLFLWLQDRVKLNHLIVAVVKGTENPADVLTKSLSRNEIMKSMAWANVETRLSCS